MRSFLLALCLAALAGCTRSATAPNDADATSEKPAATVEKPAAVLAPVAATLGEDADGKAVDGAALDAIRSSLNDADPAVRRAAVKKLARIRWKFPEPVVSILQQALADADAETRLEAVHAAAADPLRTADMARLLRDPDRRVQYAAAAVLVRLGKHEADAYPILATALVDRHAADRAAILELVRSKAPASRPTLPSLITVALDANDPLRIAAIGVLATFGPSQESLDALLIVAHDAEPKARAAALRSLGRLAPQSAKVQVALLRGLRDPQLDVSLAATEAVGRDGIPLLIERLRHGNERARDASTRALARMGPDAWAAVPELSRLAQSDPVERVRQSAARRSRRLCRDASHPPPPSPAARCGRHRDDAGGRGVGTVAADGDNA